MSREPSDLGELEREVMQRVWARGTITAEQTREDLTRPLKESTVRTVLRRLEEKGYVTHTGSKAAPTISPPPNRVAPSPQRQCSTSSMCSAMVQLKKH